ncbi:hypothetical protein [Methylobacterium radiotolerans]|uniref:hypothetical protein n=1 Tax=Methylobacterium radiotolerans TaxID=31998 RepID=UPI0007A9B7A6|nr:hypothetical protein [Methylobacterium radiotolerans]KZB98059.1 hypothetical protein AU375_05741 [Methylobacterium radiotolerans]MDE3745175.1 hypothetical protein [Methylobacterium radiotolerans]
MARAQLRDQVREGHRLGRVVPPPHGPLAVEDAEAGSALVGGAGGLGQQLEGPDRDGARTRARDLGPDRLAQGEAAGTVEDRPGRLRLLFLHHR